MHARFLYCLRTASKENGAVVNIVYYLILLVTRVFSTAVRQIIVAFVNEPMMLAVNRTLLKGKNLISVNITEVRQLQRGMQSTSHKCLYSESKVWVYQRRHVLWARKSTP